MAVTLDQICERAAELRLAGRWADAAAVLAPAIAAHPAHPRPHLELARTWHAEGRFAEALAAYETVLRLVPGHARTELDLAHLLLAMGDYRRGLALYERRKDLPDHATPRLPLPEWRGEDLRGTRLLVWREQGFGDLIQCARFLPLLAAAGAAVTAVVPEPLRRLFTQLPVEVAEHAPSMTVAAPDAYTHPFSIPHWLGIDLETLPTAPYLAAAPRASAGRVGVCWRGNISHPGLAHRSLSPAAAAMLLALPGAMSLQPEDTGAADFLETAEIIAGLDLVVTIDTATAHLAGALGKPVWIMLPAVGVDWRWGRGRTDSPWYPSARLYRQPGPHDWRPVLAAIAADWPKR